MFEVEMCESQGQMKISRGNTQGCTYVFTTACLANQEGLTFRLCHLTIPTRSFGLSRPMSHNAS